MKINDYNKMKAQNDIVKKFYVIYARKSSESDDRQAASVEEQVKILKQLARERNLKILRLFTESRSAKAPGRPVFNEMVDLLSNRNDIKGVICWKHNRLSRNPIDTGTLQWIMQTKVIDEIVMPEKIYREIDSDFMMAIDGAQAQRFIRELKEDTARGVNRKVEMGFAPILAPVGYVNNTGKKQGYKDISAHPIYFKLMRNLFELALTGRYTLRDLVVEAKMMGIKNNRANKDISKAQMARVVRNPFYTGKFMYERKLHPGKHPAMLSNDEFDLLQDIVSGRSRPRKQKHDLWFTGIPIMCGECNSHITGEYKTKKYKNGTTQAFIYGRCTKKGKFQCSQAYIPERELKQQVMETLETVKIPQSFVEWAIKWLKETNDSQKDIREAKYKALKFNYEDSVSKLDRLLNLKLENLISDAEFSEKKDKLTNFKNSIQKQLLKLNTHIDEWSELTAKTFDFASTAMDKFETGDTATRRTILMAIGSNLTLFNKKLTFEARTPFFKIQQKVKEVNSINWLEPKGNTESTENKGTLDSQNVIWGG